MKIVIVIFICFFLVFMFFLCEGIRDLPRFYKGQKVKVRKNTNAIISKQYEGEILTIKAVASVGRPHYYWVYENDFMWREDALELAYKDNKEIKK